MDQRTPPRLFGITTCDTVRKARRWLDEQGIAYQYVDLRKDGLSPDELSIWVGIVGWEKLINRSGLTFKRLDEQDKQIESESDAITLMLAHPTIIKRPVLVWPGEILLGFKSEIYEARLKSGV